MVKEGISEEMAFGLKPEGLIELSRQKYEEDHCKQKEKASLTTKQ